MVKIGFGGFWWQNGGNRRQNGGKIAAGPAPAIGRDAINFAAGSGPAVGLGRG